LGIGKESRRQSHQGDKKFYKDVFGTLMR